MDMIHGGDIYRNQISMDFSVNVNPLGIPAEVKQALHDAVEKCHEYPDIKSEKLKKTVGNRLSIPKEYLLFGNGASELFMTIIHAIRPVKTVIPIPSFYGYEYAAETCGSDIIYYPMKEEELFNLTEDFFEFLTEDVDLLFLANPNNPTGKLLSKEYLKKLLLHCREKGIYVVLDECFIEFCGSEYSVLSNIEEFDNLLLIRAFTKIFAIPGVRLGYLVCSNKELLVKLRKQLPEWNLSVFAQAGGIACAEQLSYDTDITECIRPQSYIKKTVVCINSERAYMAEKLEQLGFFVFSSDANFILIKTEVNIYEKLLKQGILIRDCSNFRGLSKGFYRIAVKNKEENDALLTVLGELK